MANSSKEKMDSTPISQMQGRVYMSMRKRKIVEDEELQKQLDQVLKEIPSERIGPFWFHRGTSLCVKDKVMHVGLQKREEAELCELLSSGFLTDEFLSDVLVPLNDENSKLPRLRLYNWYVTNFGKFKGTTLQTKDPETGEESNIDPSVSYCATLKRLHRTLFDPYRRGTLLFFRVGEIIHHTTVGQLLFLRWCKKNNVDKWVSLNEKEIRNHLDATSNERSKLGKKRVRELTERALAPIRLLSDS
jgi:hypothetical protein